MQSATPSNTKKIYMLLVAAVAWFAILLQWYLTTESLSNFFSYFTILTNLLIAVSLTYSLVSPSSVAGKFFSSVPVQSAIALYIFIVGVVYNTVLRGILTFTGWQLLVDNTLHVVTPVLYMLYWLIFIPKGTLQWKNVLPWVVFPFVYLVYTLIRGPLVNWYPYPFLNIAVHSYEKVFINIGIMIGVFAVVGLLLIAFNRSVKKNTA